MVNMVDMDKQSDIAMKIALEAITNTVVENEFAHAGYFL